MGCYKGSCLCGEAKFEVEGHFIGFFLCHCTRCQKITGSAHASNLFSKDGKLKWVSGERSVRSYRVEGTRFESAFCVKCGSKLPMNQEGKRIVVPAGSLETEVDISPDAHIFCASRAGWEDKLLETKRYDELPPRKS